MVNTILDSPDTNDEGIHGRAAWLRSQRPPYENCAPRLRLVDLFCGCGAMSLGVAEAAWGKGLGIDVRLAIDSDQDAAAVFGLNFKGSHVEVGLVERYFDGRACLGRESLRRGMGGVGITRCFAKRL